MQSLRRAPLFTSVTIVTLAIGIGAKTAIFGVVHAVLLRPLPFEEPEPVDALFVSDSTLPALGVSALVGRRFDAEDDSPRTPERVMLSHRYWQDRVGGRPEAIGQTLVVEGRPREIIGVLPAGRSSRPTRTSPASSRARSIASRCRPGSRG